MNEGENKLMDLPESDDWKAHYADLSRQMAMLRAALLVASLTLTAYLFVQNMLRGKDVEALRGQYQQVTSLSKKEEDEMKIFVGRLADYGQSHSDFMAILNKYPFMKQPPTTNRSPAAPGATLPLPAPTAPKK